jgi:hypothetical protein
MAFPDVISAGPSLDAWTLAPVDFYGAFTRLSPHFYFEDIF